MRKRFLCLVILASLMVISNLCISNEHLAFAQEEKGSPKGSQTVTQATPASFAAKVICLGCALKKGQGAKAQCSLYGHSNALQTPDGKIWTLLENDASTGFINSHEYAGQTVKIVGKKFAGTQIIEVETFKIIE